MAASPAAAGSRREVHRMRIVSGGSIKSYVQFALRFLAENPRIPLVLHTLPPDPSSSKTQETETDLSTATAKASSENPSAPGPSRASFTRESTLHGCTTTTPRLISIVEIIKREYIALLEKDVQRQQSALRNQAVSRKGKEQRKEQGNGATDSPTQGAGAAAAAGASASASASVKGQGLWQYTESGLYIPPSPAARDDGEMDLTRVLGGRTKPKMTHHPYLQITLSTRPLSSLEGKHNITCQCVATRRRSRTKTRGRKKATNQPIDANGAEEEGMKGVDEAVPGQDAGPAQLTGDAASGETSGKAPAAQATDGDKGLPRGEKRKPASVSGDPQQTGKKRKTAVKAKP